MTSHVLILNERDLDNPAAGGAEIHLFEIFGRLAAAGDRVTMLCAGFPGAAPETRIAGVTGGRYGNRYSYYTQVGQACRRFLRAERPDLLARGHNKVPFLTPLYARARRLAVGPHL